MGRYYSYKQDSQAGWWNIPNLSQPNPGLRADESPCTWIEMWTALLQEDANHNLRISLSKTESELAKMVLSETNGDGEDIDAADGLRRSRKRLSEALEVLEKNSEEMREKHDLDANGEDGSGEHNSSWGISKVHYSVTGPWWSGTRFC